MIMIIVIIVIHIYMDGLMNKFLISKSISVCVRVLMCARVKVSLAVYTHVFFLTPFLINHSNVFSIFTAFFALIE